jgi:tetratricopeptide (TPR) repeat protein
MQRLNAEHERQRAEMEQSNRTVLWFAATFGGIALLAILIAPLFQWRTLNRIAELTPPRPQLPPATSRGLLPEAATTAADQTVALSNQRLTSAIERMERRISDFEQSWSQAAPASGNGNSAGEAEHARRAAASEQVSRISALLVKGQSMVDAGKPMEAMSCYNEILRLDLNHPEALVKRGAVLERMKQDDEAIQCYDRAIKADRKMTLAYLHKGAVCNRLERYEEALKCYQQALLVEEEVGAS